MLFKIALLFACVFGAVKCLHIIVNTLKKSGQEELAKNLKEISDGLEENAKNICRTGFAKSKGAFKEKASKLSPELTECLSNEGEKLLNTIFPQGYFSGDSFDFKSNSYRYVITEDEHHPFQITALIASTTDKIVADKTTEAEKAIAIFDWFENNIKYDRLRKNAIKNKANLSYFTSSEMFSSKMGVCGEMAVLYIVMARHASLSACFVNVEVDYTGEIVDHACAGVYLDGKDVLVDPAYHNFDIKHVKFCKWTDNYALTAFRQWRMK